MRIVSGYHGKIFLLMVETLKINLQVFLWYKRVWAATVRFFEKIDSDGGAGTAYMLGT